MRQLLLRMGWCLCLLAGLSPALANETGRRGALVDPAWVVERLGKPGLVVLDTSSAKSFAEGHIPGAVNVDVYAMGARGWDSESMTARARSWGIHRDSTVVVVDAGATWTATRIYYDLFQYGFPQAQLVLLDGGMSRWKAVGAPITQQPTPAPAPGNFQVTTLVPDVRVRLPEFMAASGDPQRHALVDALEAPYHFGAAKFFDRAGHVPNAILWASSDFFTADKRFKSPDEIRRMAEHLGIRRDQTVHTHCGGGGAAAVPFFALRFLAGFEKVKLYEESQREWLRDDRGLPYWTYSAQPMLRSPEWLAGWGAPFMHMMGIAHLAVIDVRPEAAYAGGHVPQAVHVGAGLLTDSGALAQRLARAGINPADEAVIVSDRGLTREAALAFVQLQRLGQRRVSLLATSLDDWALAGHPITKDPPTLAPRQDARAPRAGVTIADAAEPGLFPTVFVGTGAQPPAQRPAGTFVHLNATELLRPDGQPKPAPDLLKAMAAVPRFARVVTLADDAGDAAIGYVLFKLMGYADVKMLMR